MTASIRFLCVFILLVLPQAALGASRTPVNAAAKNLQRTYAGMESFQADFVQKLVHKESGSVETRNGTLLFKKPMLVRWETTAPHAELIIINSREVWNYLPDEALAYRYAPDSVQDSHALIRVLTGQARLDQDFYVEEEGTEKGLLRLRLSPLEPAHQMTEAAVWIDPANYIIQRAVIFDFYGNSNEVGFTTLRPNPKLDEKKFDFAPPHGAMVEDRGTNAAEKQDRK